MSINTLKTIWDWLSKLSPDFLRLIIIILVLFVFVNYNVDGIRKLFVQQINTEEQLKQDRERYTVEITPKISKLIYDIRSDDKNVSNVILLNYHNTLVSSHGLAYTYLTGLYEDFQGDDTKPCINDWKELDYMNYGEEIQKITTARFLLMKDVQEYRNTYPKFSYLLDKENKKSAAFCPIMGVDGSVGMIVVLYNDSITQNSIDNLKRKIVPVLQPLAVLLDYDYKITDDE